MADLDGPGACAICVMAKAPQPGRAKTRLVPPLAPEQAAALSAAFLRDITENIALAARDVPIRGCIAYAPADAASQFAGMLAEGTALMLADGSVPMPASVQGIGRALVHALQASLARGFAATCLLNADSPTLPTAYLRRAAALLLAGGDRVVLGPAEDGGYYLLGARSAHAHLFTDIAWSTSGVAEQTRARAREIGLELTELPAWYDVDDVESLRRLVDELAFPHSSFPGRDCAARVDLQLLSCSAKAEHPRLRRRDSGVDARDKREHDKEGEFRSTIRKGESTAATVWMPAFADMTEVEGAADPPFPAPATAACLRRLGLDTLEQIA